LRPVTGLVAQAINAVTTIKNEVIFRIILNCFIN
jgi:hypothetical protein